VVRRTAQTDEILEPPAEVAADELDGPLEADPDLEVLGQ
jgi:hypothetical protein